MAVGFVPEASVVRLTVGVWEVSPKNGVISVRSQTRAIALGFGPAANRLLLYPASPFSRRSSRQVRLLIGMAELNVAFQSSFTALNGRPGADYDALERGPAPNAIALGGALGVLDMPDWVAHPSESRRAHCRTAGWISQPGCATSGSTSTNRHFATMPLMSKSCPI